ncbi:MAG: benzoate-CoA ligase family protein [Candidatus Rokubacteria bacterium]|nr:benzoate-CoA ligase family protein [Candidatus Rokubacteria bacterium]
MIPTGPFNAATFFVDRHVQEGRGARPAFRHEGRVLSWAHVTDLVDRGAAALAAMGVKPGERVLIALPDSPAFVAAFWGAVKLGAVAVPVNTVMTADEYAFLLEDSDATAVVAAPEVAARIDPARSLDPEAMLADPRLTARAPHAPAPTRADDVMYWGYTSGSTGRPKAAVHTHAHFVAAADCVGVGVFGLGPDDLTFSASKMFFAFGLGNTLYFPGRVGAASVLVSERLDAARALDIITRERPTVFFAVATLYARMLEAAAGTTRWDLSSLRFCVSSGEALPAALFDAWCARFGLALVDVVGSTEALHDFIANPPSAPRRGSAGRLVPGFDARLVDDAGADAPAGVVGELWIKGPTTAREYWNRPAKTAETMRGDWLRASDMFARDADGWFTFAGRADDMLKVAGQWVAPAEVEARLVEHPGVLEAGVVGRADGAGLLRAHAYVVPPAGITPSAELAETLRAWARAGLPPHKVPAVVEFVTELPKTATGKVQRFRLRAQYPGEVSEGPPLR